MAGRMCASRWGPLPLPFSRQASPFSRFASLFPELTPTPPSPHPPPLILLPILPVAGALACHGLLIVLCVQILIDPPGIWTLPPQDSTTVQVKLEPMLTPLLIGFFLRHPFLSLSLFFKEFFLDADLETLPNTGLCFCIRKRAVALPFSLLVSCSKSFFKDSLPSFLKEAMCWFQALLFSALVMVWTRARAPASSSLCSSAMASTFFLRDTSPNFFKFLEFTFPLAAFFKAGFWVGTFFKAAPIVCSPFSRCSLKFLLASSFSLLRPLVGLLYQKWSKAISWSLLITFHFPFLCNWKCKKYK